MAPAKHSADTMHSPTTVEPPNHSVDTFAPPVKQPWNSAAHGPGFNRCGYRLGIRLRVACSHEQERRGYRILQSFVEAPKLMLGARRSYQGFRRGERKHR